MAESGSIDSDKVKVAIRVRPFNRREIDLKTKCVVEVKGDQTVLHYVPPTTSSSVTNNGSTAHNNSATTATPTPTGKGGTFTPAKDKDSKDVSATAQNGTYRPPKTFTFDHCFWSFSEADGHYASQEYVFQQLGTSVLDSAFQGYNACIFAYGQTGSGKSYTMMGSPHEKGLIPRLCDALFERIEAATRADEGASFKLEVSYMEIYNEKVHDLLDPAGGTRQSLKVREHNILGPYVDGLSTLAVSSFAEIDSLMAEGNKSRTVAATNMNSESSRSHAVFTLTLTCSVYDSMADVRGERVSKMSLVDLAGSERAVKTGAVGERLKEGSNINKSLTTLGLVISKLADQAAAASLPVGRRKETSKSSTFVPYRDSVLTWLLKDNLGGNSKTIMISTISPAADSYEETLSTLRYADRAKRIVNHAVINEDPNNRIIRELREEVEQLKEQLLHATVQTELQERLVESEKLIKEMEQTWEEKLRRTEKIHQERQLALEKMGISVQSSGIAVEKDRYYLVNLNADPSMNALLVYYLKERTLIGRPDAEVEQDIQLSGVGIMPEHAVIEIDRHAGEIWMEPAAGSGGGARTYVNGRPIGESRVMLRNGDRILWGNNHFFSLNCPIGSGQTTAAQMMNRSMTAAAGAEDFGSLDAYAYARDELMSCTNPGLDAAIYALERQFEDPYRGFHQQYQQQQQNGRLNNSSVLTSPAQSEHHLLQYTGSSQFLPGLGGKFGGSQLGISGVGGGRLSGSSLNLASPMAFTYARNLEKLAQEREENMRASLSKLREEIAKANTLAHEANLISEEMRRATEFKVTLQIPAANLSPNRLRRGVFVSEPAILVKRKGAPQQVWSMEKFDGKLIEMREMYAEWKERQNEEGKRRLRSPQHSTESDTSSLSSSVTSNTSSNFSNSPGSSPNIPRRHDPFYELQENHLLVGVANIFLEVLMQDVLLDYQVPIISQQGEVAGRLAVEFGRIEGHFGERIADAAEQASDSGSEEGGGGSAASSNNSTDGASHLAFSEVTTISSPNSRTPPPPLRPNQIRVRLSVKHARGLPAELSNFVFCQYSIWGYPDLIAVPCTAVEAGDSVGDQSDRSKSGVTLGGSTTGNSKGNPDEKIFLFANSRDFTITLSEEFLEHCADGALSIEVWGHRISAFSPHSLATLKTEWGVQEEQSRLSRSLAERWRELKRRLTLWVEIHELNDNGEYVPVEVQPATDIFTGGVYQLRQGQQRRLAVRVCPQRGSANNGGTLPLLVDSVLWTAVGCVTVRPKGLLKSLDSYQEGDLNALTEKWSEALARRQAYLHEQITELMEKSNTGGGKKSQEDIEREHRLTNQWVSLVEERNAAKCPPPGSEIPGAPAAEDNETADGEENENRPPGMESHVPVIFLDLNSDDLHHPLSTAARITEVPGANSILPKEHNGSAFFNLPIVASTGGDAVEGATAVALWDSSIHESASLNRLTAPTERIFLIVKTAVRLSHPALIDVVLRKRIAINVYKKQSLTKSIFKRISRAELPLEGTGVTYELVASIPKASEDIEDRESLALLAASGVDLTACDGESYIERYTKSVSAVENLLQLERLRQEVAVREQLTRRSKFGSGRSTLMQQQSPSMARTPLANGARGSVASEAFLRKTVSVPNIASQQQHQFGVHRPAAGNASSPLDAAAAAVGGHKSGAGTPTTTANRSSAARANGDPSSAFVDLSYFSSAADRLRRGASSLFGSMTGGLNQLGGEVVIEEEEGGSAGNSPVVRMERTDVHPLSSTGAGATVSPISMSSPAATTPASSSKQQQQQHLKQPMGTLLEEQYSREDEDCDLVTSAEKESPSRVRVQVTPPKANNSSNNNNEYVVFGSDDDDEVERHLVRKSGNGGSSELRIDTPTLSIHSASSGYEGSHSQTISNSGGGGHGTTGTPISTESAVSSVPSSLSMPSSTTGSGDEEEEEEAEAEAEDMENDHQSELQRGFSKAAPPLPEWMAVGESVRISPDSKLGVIAYIGETDFAPGLWIGVVLDSPTGKNDGTVNGVTYFTCKAKFGIFVKPDKLKADPKGRALRQAQAGHLRATSTSPSVNNGKLK